MTDEVYSRAVSGIVGVWNLDNRPLEPAVLSRMSESLRHRGPDGEGQRLSGAIGFACQRLWVTAEEIGEVQPLVARNGVIAMMDGRLDNRDELLAALSLPHTISDTACALAAYQAWRDGFAERLNGDFAVAVFDESNHRLLLARDAIGVRPLYYFRSGRLFAFASEIKAVLAHPDVPMRVDDEGIADFMMVGSRPVDRQDATCFAGIFALVPAHLAVVTRDRTVTRRYWDFDPARTLQLRSFDEYIEGFRERFAEAVRRRIRSARPVAVSVSGGLDSSSIFCQAQAVRRSSPATCPDVVGISYIGAEGTEADERKYLGEIERQHGVEIERFPIEPFVGLLREIDHQIRAVEAPFLDYLWGVTGEVHRRAIAHGARILLTGHWGDQMLFSSAYLADLFRHLAWAEIRRHTREYSRHFGADGARVFARRALLDFGRQYVPRPLVRPLKWARLRLFDGLRKKPWFADAFVQRALRFACRPANIAIRFHSSQARSIYVEARSKYHVQCMEWNNKAGASHGLDTAFPFLDRDLVAFLMATPGEIHNRNGVPRALLREAMRGTLPESLRKRTSKADFTLIVNRAVAHGVPTITKALTSQSLGVQRGYLDADRLVAEVSRLSAHLAGPNCVDAWDLGDLFGLEVWLQVFLRDRGDTMAAPRSLELQESGG